MTHVKVVPLYAHEAEVINLALYRELRPLRTDLPPVPPSGRERQRRQVSRSATCSAASAPTVLLGGSGRGHGEPPEVVA